MRAFSGIADDIEDENDDNANAPQIPILRAEPLSKGVYLALFAGTPRMVHLREPHVGVRFGVEPKIGRFDLIIGTTAFVVNRRDTNGERVGDESQTSVPLRSAAYRTLNLKKFADSLTPTDASRMVAINLEQLAYVQEFKDSVTENVGSVPLSNYQNSDGSFNAIPVRNGLGFINLNELIVRQSQLKAQKLETP